MSVPVPAPCLCPGPCREGPGCSAHHPRPTPGRQQRGGSRLCGEPRPARSSGTARPERRRGKTRARPVSPRKWPSVPGGGGGSFVPAKCPPGPSGGSLSLGSPSGASQSQITWHLSRLGVPRSVGTLAALGPGDALPPPPAASFARSSSPGLAPSPLCSDITFSGTPSLLSRKLTPHTYTNPGTPRPSMQCTCHPLKTVHFIHLEHSTRIY